MSLFFVTCHLSLAWGDVIYLKDSNETVKGLVVEEHRDRIVLNRPEMGEETVLRGQIDEIFYDDPERNYLYLGNQALLARDYSLAKGFFQKALQFHPKFEEASDALYRAQDLEAKQAAGFGTRQPLVDLEKRWGLTLEQAQEKWCSAKGVKAVSLADRNGLQLRDHLVAFWSDSLAFLPEVEAAALLLGPPGKPVKLTIERGISLFAGSGEERDWPGMKLEVERLGLTVLNVTPGGTAIGVGIRPLDRIVEINGQSTRYLSLEKVRRILQGARRQGIFLSIQRDLMIQRE